MTLDKKSRVNVVVCYICAIICVVALLVCVMLNVNKLQNDDGNTQPPTQSSSSSPSDGNSGGGNDDDLISGGGEDPADPIEPVETNTNKLFQLIVVSEDVYVAPLSNIINSDGTLKTDIIDESVISEDLEELSLRILTEICAKFGNVSEITSAMLNDDSIFNLFQNLENLLLNNTK